MKRPLTLLIALFSCLSLFSQNISISGTLKDSETGEALIGANIYDPISLIGSTTNPYGFFSLRIPDTCKAIHISYVGYSPVVVELSGANDTVLNMEIEPVIEIEEVQVRTNSPIQKVRMTQMSSVTLDPKQIKNIPVLLGETDVVKSLQLMPGVQGGTEGSSGMYVRGGGPDQNLILLDGVPVYNVNHLFGFMSVFNTDAINNVTLIKGGFPARYGGRLSSVLDIRMKEGNMKEMHGEGSIGIISSNLTLEGPIKKDKTSFMVSGRRSYIDVLTYPFQIMANNSSDEFTSYGGYFLQDFNAKVNHIIDDKNRLFFSFYSGKDKFFFKDKSGPGYNYGEFKDELGLQWGNFTSAVRWNRIISPKLFMNATVLASDYTFKIYSDSYYKDVSSSYSSSYQYYFEYYSRIRDFSAKIDFDYSPHAMHQVKFGASATRHGFSPGVVAVKESSSSSSNSIDTTAGKKNIPSYEVFCYLEDEIAINSRFKANIGLHTSTFLVEGTSYFSVEPRLSARYLLRDDLSVKASYVHMSQNLHLLSNTSMGLPTDLWVPATNKIKPQIAKQASVGLSYALNNSYEITFEGYYKDMKRLITYKPGAGFTDLNNSDWEDVVTTGNGKAYGIELFAQKVTGKLTGFAGYTLSKTTRSFKDIDNGRIFPDNYDSRHDFTITASYKVNERVNLGATWTYRTGYPITLEDEAFISTVPYRNEGGENLIYTFENRNNYKLPDYHRLDISAQFSKEKRRYTRTWSFGVYNAYGKKNPLLIYPVTEYYNGKEVTRLKQITVFTFLPFVRWSFKF